MSVISIDPHREPLLKSTEVAEYLRVTPETVHRWSRATIDPLPVLRYGQRGFMRYRMSEVEQWLERRRTA
jgi:predicted DNA-binding transcriptional regulator AlpA